MKERKKNKNIESEEKRDEKSSGYTSLALVCGGYKVIHRRACWSALISPGRSGISREASSILCIVDLHSVGAFAHKNDRTAANIGA